MFTSDYTIVHWLYSFSVAGKPFYCLYYFFLDINKIKYINKVKYIVLFRNIFTQFEHLFFL